MRRFGDTLQKILIVIGAAQTVAANFPDLANLVPGNQVLNLAAGVTTARMNIPHGLGFRPALHACKVQWVGANSNAQAAVALGICATDGTNIVVKASAAQAAAEAAFLIWIELDKAVAGPNPAQQ